MKIVRSVTGAAIGAAMLATSVAPAMAQGYPGGGYPGGGYPGGGYGGGEHRHHDRIGAGEVIAGVAILGVLAAIASSGSHSRNNGNGDYDRGYRGNINSENDAADACATAVERQGVRVSNIDQVYRTGSGYQVRGSVSARGYGRDRGYGQSFTCSIRYGSVERIDFQDSDGYRGY